MKGITPQQLLEITAFVQKHHRFGTPEEPLPNCEYGLCIKYIDTIYDSREGDVWSIGFRGMGNNVKFNTNNGYFKQFDNLYDLVMAYLKVELDSVSMQTYINKFCGKR